MNNFYSFLSNEFRNTNFYTIKSSFGNTKSITTPKALYKLPFELQEAESAHQRFVENGGVIISDKDKEFLSSYGFNV